MQVLKGHIALGNARFPNGTNGNASLSSNLYPGYCKPNNSV